MFKVQLTQFEGPMDLLLFFIRRDELDIHDIPISSITEEYLEFVRVLHEVDLDSVGDFLYMAALLVNIKARLLLPQPNLENGEELPDPREELVERLLEYMRFKETAEALEVQRLERLDHFTRGLAGVLDRPDQTHTIELDGSGSVFDLICALQRMLKDAAEMSVYDIVSENYSILEQVQSLRKKLLISPRINFKKLIYLKSKAYTISLFLAALEMARQGQIHILVAGTHEEFLITRGDLFDEDISLSVTFT